MFKRSPVAIALTLTVACGPSTPPVDTVKLGAEVSKLADTYVKDYLDAFPYMAVVIGAREVHPSLLVDHSLPALQKAAAEDRFRLLSESFNALKDPDKLYAGLVLTIP